ncbi:MAG: BamA/TamA family outer membrane protein, partial [Fibrobacter sp.]|nr:BamA/TamA family outer membrane protein [Fibrobacter sp.]
VDTTGGKEGFVSVPFYIDDRKGLGLEGAIGFNSSADGKPAVFGNLTFSLVNMLHLGESASLEYAGDQKYQRLRIEIAKPWIFNLPLEISGDGTLEIVSGQYGFIAANLKALAESNSLWKVGAAVTIHEVTPSSDSLTEYSNAEEGAFYGAEFILQRMTSEYSKGVLAHQFQIQTGSGIARKSKNYSRTHFEFSGSVHIPFLKSQAVMARIVSMHLLTKEEVLLPAELYRVGGYKSVRGYADEAFPFRTAIYGQLDYRYYFKNAGAVYIFADGGMGFEKKITLNGAHQQLFGYGVGLFLPSKIGGMVLEWARNLQDRKELGRLHIRVQNSFISRNHTF